MTDPPESDQDLLFQLMANILRLILEIDSQLISMRSAVADLTLGRTDEARKNIHLASDKQKYGELMTDAIETLRKLGNLPPNV